jgi:hypothetical protein
MRVMGDPIVPKRVAIEKPDGVTRLIAENEIDKTVDIFPVASRTTTCDLYAVPAVNPVIAAVFVEAKAVELPLVTAVP